jgi:hypothetical protein
MASLKEGLTKFTKCDTQCRLTAGKSGKITGEGGLGPDYVAHVFIFLATNTICRLCRVTISNQVQVILQLTVSLSDLM